MVRRGDGEIFVSVEPATPARLRGGHAAAGDSPGQRQQLSPGLLDLHAFDTELIPDVRPIICTLYYYYYFSISCYFCFGDLACLFGTNLIVRECCRRAGSDVAKVNGEGHGIGKTSL